MWKCIAHVLYLFFKFGVSMGLEVDIELDHPHAHLEPEFLSVTIDSSILRPPKWKHFNFR